MIHPRQFTKRLKNHIKESPRVFLLYSILRILVICVLVRQIFERNYEGVGVCTLVLLLFLIPSFMEQQFEIEIPPLFEGLIYVFIFAAEILGLCSTSRMGYHSAHHQRLSCRCRRLLHGRPFEPAQQTHAALSLLCGHGRILLLHDDRCHVGIH